MAQFQLEGNAQVDNRDQEIDRLTRVNRQLDEALRQVRLELAQANQDKTAAVNAIRALRRVLDGPYNALRAVYGEIEILGMDEPQSSSQVPQPGSGAPTRWTALMAKLGGNKAAFIQAIIDFGPSTSTGIMAAMGIKRKQTVYDTAFELTRLGVIEKRGENYALKE